jgi:hypothetical protein
MDNTLRDDTGLAASRARNDEQRSIVVFNRLELFRVELQHESNQVDRRWSTVESGLTGQVGGKLPRFQPKRSVPSCGRCHSNMLLKEAILASARALSPCFLARGPPFQDSGFRSQDSGKTTSALA